jgi:metallo-beta-lactamase family protein
LLAQAVNEAHAAGGPLLIPAFAVERSQELLVDLMRLMDEGAVPEADVFLDSPLAIEATEVFHDRGFNKATGENPFARLRGDSRLNFLREPGESDRLDRVSGWHVIMAASGMCDAGRVRKHLKRLLWRPQATVLLPGYQAVGTLGRLLEDGAKRVSIQGEDLQVKARIKSLDAYSAHADARGLVDWVKARGPVTGTVFLAHGEEEALAGLRQRLVGAGLDAARIVVPQLDQAFDLTLPVVAPQAGSRRIANPSATRADWHNQRAAMLMRLNDQLETAPDDAARERLIARLVQALEGADQPS